MYSQSFINRFNQKWQLDKKTGCWVWTGATAGRGYGNIGLERQRKQEYAHRISYRLHVGEIPKGQYVLHRCDNPSCVNPSHLFVGTQRANLADMASKGRHLYGEKNAKAVLTEADIPKIRQLCASGMAQWEVGRMFGVSQITVSRIMRGKRWKHIK